jgi:hypothetical protein
MIIIKPEEASDSLKVTIMNRVNQKVQIKNVYQQLSVTDGMAIGLYDNKDEIQPTHAKEDNLDTRSELAHFFIPARRVFVLRVNFRRRICRRHNTQQLHEYTVQNKMSHN